MERRQDLAPNAKELNEGTTSDFDGNFSIVAKKGGFILFSYVGYINVRMEVSPKTKLTMQKKSMVLQKRRY